MDWGEGGGGGFMNDSIADEPTHLTNTVSVGTEERSKAISSVSVSQVHKLTRPNDGGLIIHNKKIYHVNLIAQVYEIVDCNPQKIHILVDDYTAGGPLEINHIIGDIGGPSEGLEMFGNIKSDGDEMMDIDDLSGKSLQQLCVGDYIRCVGAVKYNQDMPNIVAYHLQYVNDPNEITKHLLEVIRDSLFLERNQNNPITYNTANNNDVNSGNQGLNQMDSDNYGRLSNREKLVLKFVRSNSLNEKGVHITEIVKHMKAFNPTEVETSLQTLNSEGLCWQGDTEEYWCAEA